MINHGASPNARLIGRSRAGIAIKPAPGNTSHRAFDNAARVRKLTRLEAVSTCLIYFSASSRPFRTIDVVMRRLNGTELAALALAMFFMVIGLIMIARPSEELIFHGFARNFPPSVEFVSKDRSRAYGTLAVLLGAGIVGTVFYRRRK
jgi:hypothetical protein